MRKLLHYYYDIAWFGTWELVSFAMEVVLLAVRCSFVNLSFKDLVLLAHFLSIAVLALVFFVNHLSLSAAIVTSTTALTVHAGSKHCHLGNHAATFACATLLDSSCLATDTFALSANAFTVNFNLGCLSIVNFFKRDFKWVLHWLALLRSLLLPTAATSAEHL